MINVSGRTYRTEDEWRRLIAEMENSGKTMTKFCEDTGIRLQLMSRWRKKLGGGLSQYQQDQMKIRAYWENHIRTQKESGMSARQYCIANRLSEGAFYKHRKQLTKETAKNAYALGVIDAPAGESKAELKHHYEKAEERRAAEAKKEIAPEPKSLLERGREIVVEAKIGQKGIDASVVWGNIKVDARDVSLDEFQKILEAMRGS